MRLFFVLIACLILSPRQGTAQVLPHRAVYDITMQSHKQGGDLQYFSGRLDFSLVQTCRSWISHYASTADYHYRDRIEPIRNELTTRESVDGQNMDYAVRSHHNTRLTDNIKGQIVNGRGASVSVSTYMNGNVLRRVEFPVSMTFPVAHTQSLIEVAMKGGRFVNTPVFDGSSGDHAHHVHTVIGNKNRNNGGWPVSMAFFPYDKDTSQTDSVPDYEMHFTLFPDGIVRDMTAVYPDFTLRQSVTDLKLLEKPLCD